MARHNISLASMLTLRNERGFSMRDMKAIYQTFQSEIGGVIKFEKGWRGFEIACMEINKVFSDLYVLETFQGVPAVRCSDVQALFNRLAEIHGREIEHVNVSVDDGKGINFCILLEYYVNITRILLG